MTQSDALHIATELQALIGSIDRFSELIGTGEDRGQIIPLAWMAHEKANALVKALDEGFDAEAKS